MSNPIFPTFKGLNISVSRVGPIYDTRIQTSAGGVELRTALASTPRYKYKLDIIVRSDANIGGVDEVTTLCAFIAARKGSLEHFDFLDPVDGAWRTVRFMNDSNELARVTSTWWQAATIELITVKSNV